MNSTKLVSVAATLCLAITATLHAQDQTTREKADAAFAASEWTEAARLYREVLNQDGDDGGVWLRLGQARSKNGDYAAAIPALEKALDLGYQEVPVRYALARALAGTGDTEAALGHLDRLATLGSSVAIVQAVERDSEFESLRGDARLSDILERLTPCTAAAYREFDFWLGDWEVQNPQGQVVGQNLVTSRLDGCMLTEEWSSASGQKGFSINYFDNATGKWTQTYRDNTGNIALWPDLIGALVDGKMVLESEEGAEPMTRWIWTRISEDKVHQMAEVSNDEGANWTVVWDSYYIRKP